MGSKAFNERDENILLFGYWVSNPHTYERSDPDRGSSRAVPGDPDTSLMCQTLRDSTRQEGPRGGPRLLLPPGPAPLAAP